jgi:hypothetical protein
MGSLIKLDKAGDVLKNLSIFENVNLKEANSYSKIFNSWESIVGKKLAGYSRIKDLDKESLIVEADHPAIIQLLQLNYSENIYRLNLNYPDLNISDMRILLKNPEYKYERKKINVDSIENTYDIEHEKNKEVDLEGIDDENFKELLLKMKKRSQV